MENEDKKPKLSLPIIEERRTTIHTYESFGRAIAEQALHMSEELIKKEPNHEKDVIDFHMHTEVKPVTRKIKTAQGIIVVVVCLQICIYIAGFPICMHITRQFPSSTLQDEFLIDSTPEE